MLPQFDFELITSRYCFLSRERDFRFLIKFRLHHEVPITLVTTGTIFDPAAAFAQGRVEVIDAETGEKVPFLNNNSVSNDSQTEESFLNLQPENESSISWNTMPGDRWHKYPFDISGLVPDRTYTLRYRDHGFTKWFP